jgi:hypothetical protein
MRWHAPACSVATPSPHSCPAQHPTLAYGQNTTSCALHVAPKPLLPHCAPSARARHEPLHQAAAACYAELSVLSQRLFSASSKPPPLHLAFVSATPSMLSHLTHFLSSCAGPGASPRATGPPPSTRESHRAVAVLMSFRLDVVPLPRSVSRASTLPRHHVVAHGCAPWTPSHRPANRCPTPRAPRHALCASPSCPGRHCACPTRRVGGNVGRPHAALWAVLGQAVPYHHRAA